MIPAHLRIGSLEILAALGAFAVLAMRTRSEPPEPPRPYTVHMTIHDTPARGGRREADVRLRPGDEAVIGRASDAGIGLLDPEVSRRHAVVSLDGGVVYIADAGSSNGTFLNGRPVRGELIELRAGDLIDVGTTRMTVNEITPS